MSCLDHLKSDMLHSLASIIIYKLLHRVAWWRSRQKIKCFMKTASKFQFQSRIFCNSPSLYFSLALARSFASKYQTVMAYLWHEQTNKVSPAIKYACLPVTECACKHNTSYRILPQTLFFLCIATMYLLHCLLYIFSAQNV